MVEPKMMAKLKSNDLLTLTMQDVWIPEKLFLDMFSLRLVQQSVGSNASEGCILTNH